MDNAKTPVFVAHDKAQVIVLQPFNGMKKYTGMLLARFTEDWSALPTHDFNVLVMLEIKPSISGDFSKL